MPNKSDSAGKIHEYFTYIEFKSFYKIEGYSPFDKEKVLPLYLFSESEINGLYEASKMTFDIIKNYIETNHKNLPPKYIHHSGEFSGANSYDNTDDLIITLDNNITIPFSLKCSLEEGSILSKNMGAKSLLTSYFDAKDRQKEFNYFFDCEHLRFLNSIFSTNFSSIRDTKKYIKDRALQDGYDKDRFKYYKNAESARNIFLPKLPGKLLELISSLDKNKLVRAANIILDTGANIIYATYGKTISVKYYSMPIQKPHDYINCEVRDNRSVVLKFKKINIGFRYKFESGITSSIKLVGDYN